MSLETEVQKLTQASNEQTTASQQLAQEVSAKMAGIDNQVSELVKDVSDSINYEMYKALYVSIDGDDSNQGTSSLPVATINKAISLIPNGATARIFLKSAPVESPDNIYDVEFLHLLESRNILIAPHGGSQVRLRFMDGGAFNTRTGGSIKIGNPHYLTIEVVASRTKDTLIYQFGGDVSFGGFYTTKLINHSPSLKQLCKTGYHAGDNCVGSSFGRASFMRFDVSESTETDFGFVDVDLGGMILISTYTVKLGGNTVIYNASRQVLPVGVSNNAFILTY